MRVLQFFFWSGVRSQEVQQSPQSLIIQEEEEFNITCKFSKTLYALHWYWQKHGEGPTFLMMLRRGGEEMSRDKITATLDEKKQHSSLYITASQRRHSGTYFCAGETQWHPGLQRLYSNLKLGHNCSLSTGLPWGTYQKAHPLKKGKCKCFNIKSKKWAIF